jgi:PAS domain S-box-containing protein
MENSIKILAIDDNKDNLISLNALIKEAFPSVKIFTALNGTAGLEIAEKEDPDVILLDIVMPRMDGFEICTRLKADKDLCIIPVVFITAMKGDKSSRIRALEIGAEAFIAKPIDETELTAQIKAMLKIKKAAVERRDEKERLSAMVEERTNELNQSYQFNESLLKTIPFGMDIVDETGTVMFQNNNFKKLFGHEAIGKKCWEIYRNDKTQCVRCPLLKGISVGQTAVYESHDILDNRIFEIIHSGMIYQGRKAILEIFLDMTDKKLAEEELISARDKAEESDRLKTAFLHNISHEIRTPMNAIVGFSSLIMDYKNDEKSLHEFLQLIVKSSNHLLSIISDIVDIANIEANLVKVIKTKINCNTEIKLLFDQFLPVATKKNIQFLYETRISDDNAEILTDSTKLSQILANLISNAIKFTDMGYVKLSCGRKGNFIEYVVEDTGIGIPAEFHEKIFDRFYQVEISAARTYEGTGLGLAISRSHAELLGGNLYLNSEPGKGTTFYLTIPDENLENSELRKREQVQQPVALSTSKTILVAEDTDSNFLLIKYFLAETNITLLRAKNGKEAIEMFKTTNGIDMVLMDIKMPEMDGYSAIKHIRETNATTPIIVQSAFAGDEIPAFENGGSGFIAKPFDKKSLLKVIKEFI